jgi:hypothetical protein
MFDTTSSTAGGNLTCPGQRQLLINYIQPKAVPKSVTNALFGAWDPCFTKWLTDNSSVTLLSIPASTPYSAQQLASLVKQELCFFKWYSTFNTSSPAPWITDPVGTSICVTSPTYGKISIPVHGLGQIGRSEVCSAYYTAANIHPLMQTTGCSSIIDGSTLGTFSYIDAGEFSKPAHQKPLSIDTSQLHLCCMDAKHCRGLMHYILLGLLW